MKNKFIVIGVLMVIGLLIVTKVVLGQVTNMLPRVITACETKRGVLMGIDDGFSSLKKCPVNSRKVVLGEEMVIDDNTGGGSGNYIGMGDVVFIDEDLFLTKNGNVWQYDEEWEGNTALGIYSWIEKEELKIPVLVETIIKWNGESFLTKDGIYYKWFQYDGWKQINISTIPTPTL